MPRKINVSIIVSTYSITRAKILSRCLDSLTNQTYPSFEIILSLEPDKKLINYYSSFFNKDITLISSEGKGLSNARNSGVKKAKGDIIAFIDDDAYADKDWLRNIVECYDDVQTLGTGGSIEPVWEKSRPMWFPEELDWVVGCTYKGLPLHKSSIRNPIGCNMSFKSTVFNEIGLFSNLIGRSENNLIGSEEVDFSLRLSNAHPEAKIIYNPSAIVYHYVPKQRATLYYFIRRSFYEGLSKSLIPSYKSTNTLSLENKYLKFLLLNAVPSRLKNLHDLKDTLKLSALSICILSVLLGFLFGKITFFPNSTYPTNYSFYTHWHE